MRENDFPGREGARHFSAFSESEANKVSLTQELTRRVNTFPSIILVIPFEHRPRLISPRSLFAFLVDKKGEICCGIFFAREELRHAIDDRLENALGKLSKVYGMCKNVKNPMFSLRDLTLT